MRQWLVIAVLVAGGVLLILAFATLALALAALFLPVLVWMWFTGKLRPESGVIEGKARRVEEPLPLLHPLTEEESARLGETQVWIVRYRDEFSHDEDRNAYERYAYDVAVCFAEADAQAEALARGEPFKPGWAGYDFYGPVSPLEAFRDDGHPDNVLRSILERLAAGSRAPIVLRG